MVFGASTFAFRNRLLSVGQLEQIKKEGYRHIELFANRPHLNYRDRNLLKEIAAWFKENGMPSPSLHMPFYEKVSPRAINWLSVLDSGARQRQHAHDELKRALELSDFISLSHIVLHLGNPNEEFHPIAFDYGYAAINMIQGFANVEILIENISNEISKIDKIREFIKVAQLSNVQICYDTGHGHLQGPLPDLENVAAIHVNDNRCELDAHLWPFEGTVDWPKLIEAISMSNYDGPMVFEVDDEDLTEGSNNKNRIEDLLAQARSSINEFRENHGLRRDDENNLY